MLSLLCVALLPYNVRPQCHSSEPHRLGEQRGNSSVARSGTDRLSFGVRRQRICGPHLASSSLVCSEPLVGPGGENQCVSRAWTSRTSGKSWCPLSPCDELTNSEEIITDAPHGPVWANTLNGIQFLHESLEFGPHRVFQIQGWCSVRVAMGREFTIAGVVHFAWTGQPRNRAVQFRCVVVALGRVRRSFSIVF